MGDTWTWNGAGWHRAATAGPSARYAAAAAYDAGHKQFVLYGGQTVKGSSDETWLWDGTRWRVASPVHKPAARRAAAMAWDPASHRIVMYGGLVADQLEGHEVGETWTWDGSDWTEVDPGPGPPGARQGASLVTAGDRVLLFGGHVFNVTYYGDAWSWNEGTWTPADRAPRPPGRGGAAAAWDSSTSSLLVYGGDGLNAAGGPGAFGTPLADGWALRDSKWTSLGDGLPGQTTLASVIWTQGGFVLLLGMHCPNPSDAAWAWDGIKWRPLESPGIPARWAAAVAQAPDGTALLFGGSNQKGC